MPGTPGASDDLPPEDDKPIDELPPDADVPPAEESLPANGEQANGSLAASEDLPPPEEDLSNELPPEEPPAEDTPPPETEPAPKKVTPIQQQRVRTGQMKKPAPQPTTPPKKRTLLKKVLIIGPVLVVLGMLAMPINGKPFFLRMVDRISGAPTPPAKVVLSPESREIYDNFLKDVPPVLDDAQKITEEITQKKDAAEVEALREMSSKALNQSYRLETVVKRATELASELRKTKVEDPDPKNVEDMATRGEALKTKLNELAAAVQTKIEEKRPKSPSKHEETVVRPSDEPVKEPPKEEPKKEEPPIVKEEPKKEPPMEEPKKEEPPIVKEEPKKEEPPKEEPKKEEPPIVKEEPKKEPPMQEPKKEEPPKEEPKKEEPPVVKEEPKKEEPKKEQPPADPKPDLPKRLEAADADVKRASQLFGELPDMKELPSDKSDLEALAKKIAEPQELFAKSVAVYTEAKNTKRVEKIRVIQEQLADWSTQVQQRLSALNKIDTANADVKRASKLVTEIGEALREPPTDKGELKKIQTKIRDAQGLYSKALEVYTGLSEYAPRAESIRKALDYLKDAAQEVEDKLR